MLIVVEFSLHPFQRDLPLIDEVIERDSALGFRLYDTADEERRSSGTLAQVDVIFFVRTAPCSPPMVELKIRDESQTHKAVAPATGAHAIGSTVPLTSCPRRATEST